MLPFPTPAITMPLAPLSTAQSIKSGDMSAEAKMMSTRGSCVTWSTSNSLCVVCFHAGLRKEVILAVAGNADQTADAAT